MAATRSVACVSAVHPDVFKWLGPKHLLAWTLDRMEDVRGLDEVFIVATKGNMAMAGALAAKPCYDVMLCDDDAAKDDLKLMGWLSRTDKARKVDRLLYLRPFTPFMPAGRMEQCLELLKGGKNKAVMTAQKAEMLHTGTRGEHTVVRGLAPVTGLRAIKPQLLWSDPKWPGDFATVDVSFREGFDVSDPERFEVAQAIVDSGAL